VKVHRLRHWKPIQRRWVYALRTFPFLLAGGIRRTARGAVGKFVIRKLTVTLPRLPAPWNGLTITHVSDFHFGPTFTPEHHLPPVIDAIGRLRSDLICITGDWIDFRNRDLEPALPLLRTLDAPLGVYACLGNHDFYENRWRLVKLLRSWLGPNLLRSTAATFERRGSLLALLGFDYEYGNRKYRRHLRAALRRLPDGPCFKICLAHDPNLFDPLRRAGIELTLSGHTHGGQISLTAYPQPVIGPAMFRFRYFRGLYSRDGAALHVTAGLGQSVPLRWNNPPEIVQLTLRRKGEDEPARP
jgi:uncharacterized protein